MINKQYEEYVEEAQTHHLRPAYARAHGDALHRDGAVAGSAFLIFTLGEQEYGIDILKVQEIRGYDNVTRIANVPAYIKGVINLRGIVVPIVDMRIKFQLEHISYDHQTVVIILNIAQRVVGMVVDSVSDVLTLTAEQMMPAPEFGSMPAADYLTGLGSVEGRMLILIDIEKLMTGNEIALLDLSDEPVA